MRGDTGDGADAKATSGTSTEAIPEKDTTTADGGIGSITIAPASAFSLTADEEFVGPEYEEDAYYSSTLAATPSFDDLDASDSEEILVHWHQDTGEIEEIEEAEFREEESGHLRSTRRELRLLKARIREKSRRLLGLVKGDLTDMRDDMYRYG